MFDKFIKFIETNFLGGKNLSKKNIARIRSVILITCCCLVFRFDLDDLFFDFVKYCGIKIYLILKKLYLLWKNGK